VVTSRNTGKKRMRDVPELARMIFYIGTNIALQIEEYSTTRGL
jgi:hypothetical protein